jgi:hypothetical protein
MINTNNISLKATSNNALASSGTTNLNLDQAASYLGRKRPGTDWNSGNSYWADGNYELWAMGNVAIMQGVTGPASNFSRNPKSGNSSGQNTNYHHYVPLATTFRIYPYNNNTAYYKNGTLQGTVNVGSYANITCAAGDRFSADEPIATYPTSNPEYEAAYSGWSGFKFASRVDRYQTTTFYVFAPLSTVANINAYATTTSDASISDAGFAFASTTNLSHHGMWSFNVTTITNNILIEASDPICVVAYGSSTRDVRRLYPLNRNDKFGVFSSGGHIFSCANWDNNAVNATLVGYSSNQTSTTNFSTAFDPQNAGGKVFYTDSSGGPTGGSAFVGPAVRLKDTTGKSLFTAESQGDGDGGEMTSFVDQDFMGGQSFAYLPGASDWVGVISYGGSNSAYVHEWNSSGWKIRSWRFTQHNGLQDIQYAYCQRMTNSTTAPPLFQSDTDNIAVFWDKAGQYEDNQFPSDNSDLSVQTTAQWPAIYFVSLPFGTAFSPTLPEIQNELCVGASPTANAYGDTADPNSSTYMYSNSGTTQGNWITANASGQTVFFTDNPNPGGTVWKIENYDANDNELLYQHVQVGVCEEGGGDGGDGGGRSDRRLKENITQIDTSPLGIPVYTFNYIGNDDLYKGVMAQDLIELGFEDAVGTGEDGYYFVRYDMIDVDMEKL